MSMRQASAIAALALAGVAIAACAQTPEPVAVTATLLASESPGDTSSTIAPIPMPTSPPSAPEAAPPTVEPIATPEPTTTPDPATPVPTPEATATPTDDETATTAERAFIEIESVGIRHPIGPGGLNGGIINPPGGTVIWFTGYDRVKPGEVGTAVIAGHVTNGGRPDVFHELPGVRPGDTVRIGQEDAGVKTYRVIETKVADKDDVARDPAIWGANNTSRRIAIITCDSALGFRGDGHRVANFVAIAEPI